MNSSNNLKTGQNKLSVQMLVLAVVIVLVAIIGLWINQPSTGGSLGGENANQSTVKLLKDIYSTHTNLYKIQNMVATNQDKKEIEKFADQQAAVLNEDLTLVKKALDSDISSDQKKFYSALLNNLTEYQKSVLRFTKLAPSGTGTPYLASANEKMDAIGQLLGELTAFEGKTATPGAGPSKTMFYTFLIILIILLIVSVVIVPSFIKNTINAHVNEPLQETASVLREFAGGKFNKTLTWDADDAIGELVSSVNALRTKMSGPPTPASKAAASEPVTMPAPQAGKTEEASKSLSGMVKKSPDQESLVTSSKKAIDKLQDI